MSSPSSGSPNKRKESDLMKLMMSEHEVTVKEDSVTDFVVKFHGPKESPYEGGVWRVQVELPPTYPYKSPSIGFLNRIYHPNIDLASGSVCLDVINQTWTPMYDLRNIFETFLPQLLLYPNPTDPLNGEAAALLLREPEKYKDKVKEITQKYALPSLNNNNNHKDDMSDSDDDMKLDEDEKLFDDDDDEPLFDQED